MGRKQITYAVITSVFVFSLGFLIWSELNNKALEFLAGIPLVSALVVALFQIMRDQAAYERDQLLMDYQNRFVLGASSHMANLAFDRHVEFCEEYIHEAHEALNTLYRKGPSEEALTHAGNLSLIRRKHAMWIADEIEHDLEPFEKALRQMGASAGYVAATTGDYSAAQRPAHLDRMYKIFSQVTGEKEWDGETLMDSLAITSQVRYLRGVLGIEELNKMRQAIVTKAMNEFRN